MLDPESPLFQIDFWKENSTLVTYIFISVVSLILCRPILKFMNAFFHLFFSRRFELHRIGGLLYIIQWFAALIWYFSSYETFVESHLVWSLPTTGVLQAVSASLYFRFLPKKADPGYYSDKYSLSYAFVVENIFFSSLLLFQFVYYCDRIRDMMPYFVELFFVFLPYFVRPLFPHTHFRDSISSQNTSDKYARFYTWSTYLTKAFYIWAKHYIGFYLNYVRFLDRATPAQQYHVYLMVILSCLPTSVSIFLHTLAIKGYISRPTAFTLYVLSYLSTFYSWFQMADIFANNWDLFAITLIGIIVNFQSRKCQYMYQILVLSVIASNRAGYHQWFMQ